MSWFGTLKEGAGRRITMDTLWTCGIQKGAKISDLAKDPTILNTEKEVQLTIDWNEYDGKRNLRINWVNEVGGAAFRDKLNDGQAATKLDGMNLEADLAQVKMERDGNQPELAAAQNGDVPF